MPTENFVLRNPWRCIFPYHIHSIYYSHCERRPCYQVHILSVESQCWKINKPEGHLVDCLAKGPPTIRLHRPSKVAQPETMPQMVSRCTAFFRLILLESSIYFQSVINDFVLILKSLAGKGSSTFYGCWLLVRGMFQDCLVTKNPSTESVPKQGTEAYGATHSNCAYSKPPEIAVWQGKTKKIMTPVHLCNFVFPTEFGSFCYTNCSSQPGFWQTLQMIQVGQIKIELTIKKFKAVCPFLLSIIIQNQQALTFPVDTTDLALCECFSPCGENPTFQRQFMKFYEF